MNLNDIKEYLNDIKSEINLLKEIDEMEALNFLIDLGKKLEELDPSKRTPEKFVQGCNSQTYIDANRENDKIKVRASSTSLLTKGFLKIIVNIFNDLDIKYLNEAIKIFEDFIKELEINFSVESRQNAIMFIIKKIKTIFN